MMSGSEEWILPPLTVPLENALTELQGISRGGLEEEKEGDHQEVKGLKFISNKLVKLFERNRKLKYSHISKILIQNFSSQSNDSRNIKRRVYDAINVMVAAGLFSKNGDMLEKKESSSYRRRVETLRVDLSNEQNHTQVSVNNKKLLLSRLGKRKQKLEEILTRNRQKDKKSQNVETVIMNPIVVNLKEGIKKVQLKDKNDEEVAKMELGKSARSRKIGQSTEIFKDEEYLQYL